MLISHSIDRSARRRSGRVLALAVLITAACTDPTGPVAPPKGGVPELATPAAAQYPGTTNTDFFGVQVQSEAMGISIKFDYAGSIIPAFTVGTGPDVFKTQITTVAAKKQAPGYWTAHVGGLESGKLFYFRIDNLKSAYWSTAKTLRRDVTLDLDSIYVSDDSDPGPGCGEWTIKADFTDADGGYWYEIKDRVFCSGNMYRFTGPGEGAATYWGVSRYAWLAMGVKEADNCFPYEYYCWEHNEAIAQGFDFGTNMTTIKFDQSLRTTYRPRARYWGKFKIAYVNWW